MLTKNSITKTLLASILLPKQTESLYESNHLFPNNDEYDLAKINPETLYGSPYGGFSRASASRLAKLPLLLRSGFDDGDKKDDSNRYFELNDSNGRNFICKGYNKNDISYDDAVSSMFNEIIDYHPNSNKDNSKELENDIINERNFNPNTAFNYNPQNLIALMNALHHTNELDDEEEWALEKDPNGKNRAHVYTKQKMSQVILKDFHDSLDAYIKSQLDNVCTQKHDGWWSYNYCYQKGIGQFHIETKLVPNDNKMDTSTSSKSVASVKASIDTMIRIGTVASHKYIFSDDFSSLTIKEHYENGDVCDVKQCNVKVDGANTRREYCETVPKERNAIVHLTCCSKKDQFMMKKSSKIEAELSLNDLFITGIQEVEECSYKLNVCSLALCSENWKFGLSSLQKEEYKHKLYNLYKGITHEYGTTKKKDDGHTTTHSIRDILRKTLIGRCLTRNEGWWTYEFCHGKHVRQFHSQTIVDPVSGKHRTIVETQHKLGYFESPSTSDMEMLHNSTTLGNSNEESFSNNVYVYYEMEYKQGDTCIHTDEDESTLDSFPEGIDRSTSVRFSCGEKYELLSVNEDSTCHYVIEIGVPDLCSHALFHVEVKEEPVYVVKCLH